MKYIIVILSFLLDGVFSNIFPINSVFYPLFTLVSFVVVYPYYSNNSDYFKYSVFIGVLYDLVYTDTFIFYGLLFLIVSFIISKLSVWFADNYFSLLIITLVSIVVFKITAYILMVLAGSMPFSFKILFAGIYNSLIVNIIYAILLSKFTSFVSRKLGIRKSLRY